MSVNGKDEEDPFIKHAALIWCQDGCTVAEARFRAWCEGPEGYNKRLKVELEEQGENN